VGRQRVDADILRLLKLTNQPDIDVNDPYNDLNMAFFEDLANCDWEKLKAVLLKLKTSPVAHLRWLAERKSKLVSFENTPWDISFPALRGQDGERIDISKLRGKVVLLDTWNVECAGCIARLPVLQNIYEKYAKAGLEVVGLLRIVDDSKYTYTEEVSKATEILRRGGVTYKHGVLSGQDIDNFKYAWWGSSWLWLIDQNGHLVREVADDDVYGPREGESKLDHQLKRLLRQGMGEE
jgi:thiol-disulfide isomerase/thioredoxin